MPKFGTKVPHLWCDSHTSFKVKRSKGQRSRSPGPLMLTRRPQLLANGKAYELQTWYTDGGRRLASATGAITSKVKGQGRKVTWWVCVLAQCCTCVISGRRGHTVSAEPGGHTSCIILFYFILLYFTYLFICSFIYSLLCVYFKQQVPYNKGIKPQKYTYL